MSKPIRLIAVLLICAVLLPAAGSPFLSASAAPLAASAPDLGTAASCSVLAGSTVTNTGPSSVVGDLGISPGTSATGFTFSTTPGPGTVSGNVHLGDTAAGTAQTDVTTAYNDLAGQPCVSNLTGQDLGGMTLAPGVYCFPATSAQLTGNLHLSNPDGDPNPVWVFQIGSTLTTAPNNASVVFDNTGSSCNVFWQVGSSATLDDNTQFIGNILASAAITMNGGAALKGRALAKTAVTMISNTISDCSSPTAIAMRDFQATSAAGSPFGLGAGAGLLLALGLIVARRRRAPATPSAAPSARQG